MAGRGQGHGGGRGHGKGHGPDDLQRPDQTDETRGRSDDGLDHVDPGEASLGRGRSDESPGHRKKAAGAQNARDFAPGRQGRS